MNIGRNIGNAIRRFGGAMIVPVLLFPFFGIIIGIATLFKNESIMGGLANPDGIWFFKYYSLYIVLVLQEAIFYALAFKHNTVNGHFNLLFSLKFDVKPLLCI